jgi:deoxyribonuclease-4
MKFLRGMHLNDAKGEYAGRLDRHAPLGQGSLGRFPFEKIAADRRFDNIPLILETPDESLWKEETAFLLSFSSKN